MNRIYWLALSFTPGIGGVTIRKLLDKFGDIELIFNATPTEIAEVPRISLTLAQQLLSSPFDQIETELINLIDEGIDLLTWDDSEFPSNLRSVHDAPFILFMRGNLVDDDDCSVAIVGTRQPTEKSVYIAERMANSFAENEMMVVSGLAEGVDTAAHKGVLSFESGRTIAVLGSGIRVIHPRSNSELAERIITSGALLSEFHPNTPPRRPQLMARDRVISGLSKAVIVVEAGKNSGSLDTAAKAQKQGRLLYAIPGSLGTDELIENGARVIDPNNIDMDSLVEEINNHQLINLKQPPKPKQSSFL